MTMITALALILSIVAIVIITIEAIILFILARNIANHVKKFKETSKSLKEDLEQQIANVEKKIKDHSNDQAQWKTGLENWVRNEITGQGTKYEIHVKKIHDSLETITKNRDNIANEIGRFVRVLVAALKGERALFEELTKVVSSEGDSQASVQSKPTDSDAPESQQ